ISTDGSCGMDVGKICPEGTCCSRYGFCGTSKDYCGMGCQSDYGKCDAMDTIVPSKLSISTDGSCGMDVGKICPEGTCCSRYGFCGTSEDYCGMGCQSDYGKC
ncbi:hypothetical protein BCR36DRAFT_243293, partial [Piromyces finnis]